MTEHKSDQKHAHVKQLLSKMDPNIAATFNYKQRKALQKAINTRAWDNHKVDFRPTLAFPFLPWSFYIVFLAGVNKRSLKPTERFTAAIAVVILLFVFLFVLFSVVFVILYILKSWLGIDIFPNESLGIWDSIVELFS